MKIQTLGELEQVRLSNGVEHPEVGEAMPAYEYLNIHARIAKSSASVPFSFNGGGFVADGNLLQAALDENYPDIRDGDGVVVEDNYNARLTIARAARSVYGWRTAASRAIFTAGNMPSAATQMGEDVRNEVTEDIKNYKFLPEFDNLKDIEELPEVDLAAELANLEKAANSVMATESMYTPYFVNGEQLTIHDFMRSFYEDFKAKFPSLLAAEAIPVIFDRSEVNRARVIPSYIPFSNKPMDFDSGQCDIGNNTSFKMGQTAYMIGHFQSQALVVGRKGIGWVDQALISQLEKIKHHGAGYSPVQMFSSAMRHSAAYNHSVNDCSMFVGRCLALAGKEVANYSSDLMDDLANCGLPLYEMKSQSDLYDLKKPGIYVVQLQIPPKEPGKPARSRHVYMAAIDKTGNMHVISQTFNIHDRNKKIIYPVGPCYQQREDLAVQIEMGRYLRAVQIAGE